MRVIHVLPHSLEPFVPDLKHAEDWQGVEHHSVQFARQLHRANPALQQEFWVLSSTTRTPFEATNDFGLRLRVFPRDLPLFLPIETSLPLLRAAWQEGRARPPDLWHLHGYYLWMYDFLAPLLAFLHQPFVAHHRGGGFTLRALPYSIYHYGAALPLTLRLARWIFVQNRREHERLLKWYRISPTRIHLVPNCCELAASLAEHPNAVPRIITVGRMIPYKGILEILATVQRLRDEHGRFELDFVGNGDLLPTLRDQHREPWVRFHGHVPRSRVLELLTSSDVFVLGTTKREGSPQALIDAQGLGLPAVAFRVEGIEDVMADGVTGFLVNTWEEFAFRVRQLLQDEQLRTQFSAAARARIQREFSCVRTTQTVLSAYRDVVDEGARGPDFVATARTPT